MPSPSQITVPQLARLIGLPGAPALVDVRTAQELKADARSLPAARLHGADPIQWARQYAGLSVIVYCQRGLAPSQGVAAWLRHEGIHAQTLEGGYQAWCESGEMLVRTGKLPARDASGRTVWVTRARPKIVRIACPWLIRRFIDPAAAFLFVAPAEVPAIAAQFNATPFDAGNGLWNDNGDRCTFDVMIEEFGLNSAALLRLARIIRGADTGQLDLTPQSAGLLAASLGYSRMYRDDLAQLDAALALYDAYYRWCRDASDETHG